MRNYLVGLGHARDAFHAAYKDMSSKKGPDLQRICIERVAPYASGLEIALNTTQDMTEARYSRLLKTSPRIGDMWYYAKFVAEKTLVGLRKYLKGLETGQEAPLPSPEKLDQAPSNSTHFMYSRDVITAAMKTIEEREP